MCCTGRLRQKPKMEIVLTKSAEFDAIVAEENEPNAADSEEYGGNTLSAAGIISAILTEPLNRMYVLKPATPFLWSGRKLHISRI